MRVSAPPAAGIAAIDSDELNAFAAKAIGEIGAVVNAALVVTRDRLGLYRALAANGRLTSMHLAQETNADERYTRERLSNQAAGGYVEYDGLPATYLLPPVE